MIAFRQATPFPAWICVTLRILGALAFVAASYAVFVYFAVTLAAKKPVTAAEIQAAQSADTFVTFVGLLYILGLTFWGTFLFWLASAGDTLRQIELNTR